jgi:hypothetical protein
MRKTDDSVVSSHISLIRSTLETILLSYDALIKYVQMFGDEAYIRELKNQRLCVAAFITTLEQKHED